MEQMTLFDLGFFEEEITTKTKKTAAKQQCCAKKKKWEENRVKKFILENNDRCIEDWCSETSPDFKSYCRELKNALRAEAKKSGMDVTLKPGHYDMHGFFKKNDHYVYWSFNVCRGDMKTPLTRTDAHYGFLYRTAESEKDYTGGNNHFTNLENLIPEVLFLLERNEKKQKAA